MAQNMATSGGTVPSTLRDAFHALSKAGVVFSLHDKPVDILGVVIDITMDRNAAGQQDGCRGNFGNFGSGPTPVVDRARSPHGLAARLASCNACTLVVGLYSPASRPNPVGSLGWLYQSDESAFLLEISSSWRTWVVREEDWCAALRFPGLRWGLL